TLWRAVLSVPRGIHSRTPDPASLRRQEGLCRQLLRSRQDVQIFPGGEVSNRRGGGRGRRNRSRPTFHRRQRRRFRPPEMVFPTGKGLLIRLWHGASRPIGIGGAVARSPLPHHRTCGSAYGGSAG